MKVGQRVMCVGLPNDKYNPADIEGTIVSLDGFYNPIIVEWDNGLRNSYIVKNLKVIS